MENNILYYKYYKPSYIKISVMAIKAIYKQHLEIL